jgi:hypothetical protein
VEGKVKVTAVLQNPDGVYEDEFSYQYPDNGPRPSYEKVAASYCAQVAINGGFLQKVDAYVFRFIPMLRVKDIQVEFSAIDHLGLVANVRGE